MQKPNSYEETKISSGYEAPELGGHKAIIKDVREMVTSTGLPMVKICFDFDKDDAQADYFTKAFKEDTRENKKWGFAGTMWILVNNFKDPSKTNRDFKRFCTSVEDSNVGFKIPWGDGFSASFKGKKVGVVFGEVESLNDKCELKVNSNPRWFCDVAKALEQKIPDIKKLSAKDQAKLNASTVSSDMGFVNIPDGIDEELPFN